VFLEYYEKKKDFRKNDPHFEGLVFLYFSFGVIENDLYHYFFFGCFKRFPPSIVD